MHASGIGSGKHVLGESLRAAWRARLDLPRAEANREISDVPDRGLVRSCPERAEALGDVHGRMLYREK